MNNYELAIDALDLSPYRREWCCVCGKSKTDGHHVVYRSHGGKDKHIVSLCRSCHFNVHAHTINFKAHEGTLWVLVTREPMSLDKALRTQYIKSLASDKSNVWRDLSKRAGYFETEWSQ